MKKVLTFATVISVAIIIGFVVNFVSAGATRYSRDTAYLQQWHMEYTAIHP